MESDRKITKNTTVGEVIADPAFGGFGRLLFPVDRAVSEDTTLAELSTSSVYIGYSYIQPDKTVEIIQSLKTRSENDEQIFYPIYSEAEMAADRSLQPVVDPQLSHLRQVPLRTSVKLPHSPHESPS